MTEEVASLNSLHGTTTGENIFKEADKALIQYNMKWNLLRCVTIDGTKICVKQKNPYLNKLQSL